MQPAETSDVDGERPRAGWFDTALGAYLLSCEQSYFDAEVADVFGYNAFQLGLCRHDFLRASRIPRRLRVGEIGETGPVRIRADYHHLPISNNTEDLVVMPHVLGVQSEPAPGPA